MGLILINIRLGNPDAILAIKYWTVSSQLGHPDSIYNLGIFYLNGFGIDPDIRTGVKMIRLAIKTNTALELPPSLAGMDESQLDKLIELSLNSLKNATDSHQFFLIKLIKKAKAIEKEIPKVKKKKSKKKLAKLDSLDSIEKLDYIKTSVILGISAVMIYSIYKIVFKK